MSLPKEQEQIATQGPEVPQVLNSEGTADRKKMLEKEKLAPKPEICFPPTTTKKMRMADRMCGSYFDMVCA